MKLFILCILLLSSTFVTAAPRRASSEYVKLLNGKVKREHLSEYRQLRAWGSRGFPSPAPAFSPTFTRIIGLFEKVYRRASEEAQLAGDSTKARKWASSSRWYGKATASLGQKAPTVAPVSEIPPTPEAGSTEETPEPRRRSRQRRVRPMARASADSDRAYFDFLYLRFTPKVVLKGATTEETVESDFVGYAVGGGYRFFRGDWVYGIGLNAFLTNGDVEATKTAYKQENAVIMGAMLTPSLAYALTPGTLIGVGLPVGFDSLKSSASTTTKPSLEASFLFGPEVYLSQRIFSDFALDVHGGLWQGAPLLRLGISYSL